MSDPIFDMPDASHSFEDRGGWLVRRLSIEFGLEYFQAAGLVGNLGFESGGFKALQERAPIGGRGGYGWAQWTADRRVAFEQWAAQNGLKPSDDEANFGYLLVELRGAYRSTITKLKMANTLADAVFSVGQTYERPGGTTPTHLPGFDGRLDFASRALSGVTGVKTTPSNPTTPDAVDEALRALQTALKTGGYYSGAIDGKFGPLSQAALTAYYRRKGG